MSNHTALPGVFARVQNVQTRSMAVVSELRKHAKIDSDTFCCGKLLEFFERAREVLERMFLLVSGEQLVNLMKRSITPRLLCTNGRRKRGDDRNTKQNGAH